MAEIECKTVGNLIYPLSTLEIIFLHQNLPKMCFSFENKGS
jgi:hypothetical protein